MASVWKWIHQQRHSGSPEQQELARQFTAALDEHHVDNARSLARLVECRVLADRYNEPWWAMLCEHWRLQIMIHQTSEMDTALDLAVRCAVETRKEKYRGFPQRVCLHEDLIYTYKHKDPIGYETEVRDAIRYMENEASEDAECRGCIHGLKYSLEEDLGNYREAFGLAMDAAAFADSKNDDHHLSANLIDACAILYRGMATLTDAQYQDILGWASSAEEMVKRRERWGSPRPEKRAHALFWQAFALRNSQQEDEAKRRFATAVSLLTQTDEIPSDGAIQAVVAYHEKAGEMEKALGAVEQQVKQLTGKGKSWSEAYWLWERCRLRSATGQLGETDLDQAMALTMRFKKPVQALTVLTDGAVSFENEATNDE